MVVGEGLEGVDALGDLVDILGQVGAGVELVSSTGLGALDASVEAQRLDGFDEGGRPFRRPQAFGPTRLRFGRFFPSVEARTGDADGYGGRLGGEPVRHGATPPGHS